jgi:hypothetical protein
LPNAWDNGGSPKIDFPVVTQISYKLIDWTDEKITAASEMVGKKAGGGSPGNGPDFNARKKTFPLSAPYMRVDL